MQQKNDIGVEAVICLGAGESQLPLIKAARRMGLSVVAVDRNAGAVGFGFADEKIVAGTYDSAAIMKELLRMRERLSFIGVLNRSSGWPVIAAAEICEAMGLPGVPVASARAILFKSRLTRECFNHGIRAPETAVINRNDAQAVITPGFPFIVKPSLSLEGKGGVKVVMGEDQFAAAVDNAYSFAEDGDVLVQELCEGRDVTLVSVVRSGKLCPVTLIDEINSIDSANNVRSAAIAVPSLFAGTEIEMAVVGIAEKIVALFDIDTSPFMMSCRVKDADHIALIEIHLDLGGDLILDVLLPASSAEDMISVLISMLVGKEQSRRDFHFSPAAVLYSHIPWDNGKIGYRVLQYSNRYDIEKRIADGLVKYEAQEMLTK